MRDNLSCEEMKQIISVGGQLIDVRSTVEFQHGALQGAVNMPIESFRIHAKAINPEKPVLLYCRTGMRSAKVKEFLQTQGFSDVYNLGGYQHYASCQMS